MATVAPPSIPQAEPADPSFKPLEISFPLPKALHTTAHVHLTFLDHCAMVFLATSTAGDSGGTVKPLGSFVYAMPDVSATLDIFCLPDQNKMPQFLFLSPDFLLFMIITHISYPHFPDRN